jgi:alcohol dehydrogenase (cytochrome c)
VVPLDHLISSPGSDLNSALLGFSKILTNDSRPPKIWILKQPIANGRPGLVRLAALVQRHFAWAGTPGRRSRTTGRGIGACYGAALLRAIAVGRVPLALFALVAGCTQDWPSYNRTLRSERFSPVGQINRSNVSNLEQRCVYEIGAVTTFTSGLVVVGRRLYATTISDIFAIDADNCRPLWRTHEEIPPGRERSSRGAAYLSGKLFRGFPDGTVRAYDAASGHSLWRTKIADPAKGESLPAAPVAWNGLVFIGNAGGDVFDVHGRMYALRASTGRIVWQFSFVPEAGSVHRMPGVPDTGATWGNKPDIPISGGGTWSSYTLDPAVGTLYISTGNPAPDFDPASRPGDNLFTNAVVALDARTGHYRAHYPVTPGDWHDWDVTAAPSLLRTRQGQAIVAVAAKDGHLYAFDLKTQRRLYKTATTTIENTEAPLALSGTHFCPGNLGGTEWNGPAYSPRTNLIYTGAVDWCTTLRLMPLEQTPRSTPGRPWTGAQDNLFGEHDTSARGWITAIDADSGELRWKFQTPNVQISAVTPTSGGLILFADGNGTAYALDQDNGMVLWQEPLGAGAGGGVITYTVAGKQRVAFAAGLHERWPTANQAPARIVILGLR